MGMISSLVTYAPKIEFAFNKKGAPLSRLKIENIEQSIAFKTEKELKFYNKRNFVPLKAKDDKGRLVTVYVNINSLAKNLNLSKAVIKEESKQGHLEALMQSKSSGKALSVEKETQAKARDQQFQEKFGRIKHLDPALPDRTIQHMGKMMLEIETRLEKDGTTYLDTLERQFQKKGSPLLLNKAKSGFPYSIEYHGKSEGGDPILYIKYQPNFAGGATKKVTKALDFCSERVLAKGKVLNPKEFEDEIHGHALTSGIRGTLSLVHVLYYSKRGKARLGLYTDFKNRGVLERLPSHLPPEQKKEVVVLGLYYLLETLEQIHAKGIVHRDIKPGNIFVAQNREGHYQFYLGDPGLASFKENQLHYLNGTFFAPEQRAATLVDILTGKTALNEKVDVYALGLTWLEMLKPIPEGLQPISELLEAMRTPNPNERPSAAEAKEQLLLMMEILGIDPENSRYAARALP